MNRISPLFQLPFYALFTLVIVITSIYPNTGYAQQSIFDTSASSLFSNDAEFLKVDQAFIFNFDQQNNLLHISFDISEGYYLYRHQFKFSSNDTKFSPVNLPKGIDHDDEFFGVQQIYTESLNFSINIEQANENSTIAINYQGCADKGLCYPPTKKLISLDNILTTDDEDNAAVILAANSEQHQLANMLKQDSLLLTLIAFFIGGLLLSFTPCVFPMYPILTGIIVGAGKQITTKKAFTLSFFYVQGMAITYTLLGVVVALAGAQFQAMFQHPAVLVALSILFTFLALSMFGVFNLALPASWQNKLNNLSNQQKGGSIIGVITMGIISGLVASPCTTAPLTGALLYISQTGNVVLGATALYALSLGMGLPLLILGSSGGKLLPKSGAWMNIIKNIFGLLLLAVPIFLLERFIPEAASQALWALLILGAASYFYVVNQNSVADKRKGFAYGLRSLLIFIMMFVGAKMAYQLVIPSNHVVINHNSTVQKQHFILVSTLQELTAAVRQANNQNKTVMVDLYADWCVACKEFEKYTFPEDKVQQALSGSVLLKVDLTDIRADKNIALMEHFNVFGLPSILFFDLQGNELSQQRITGFMDADDFSSHIKAIF